MFNNELKDIYQFEKNNGISHVMDLARCLVSEYKKENNFKKEEKIIHALTNILGYLFVRYSRSLYYSRTNKSENIPVLFIPTNNQLFSKTKCTEVDYIKIKENIKSFHLTHVNLAIVVKILTNPKNNLCTKITGIKQISNSFLILNPIEEWNKIFITNDIIKNLQFYSIIGGKYLDKIKYDGKKIKPKPIAYIKVNKKYIIKASKANTDITMKINNLLPQELKAEYSYTRIYNDDELSGGRFYSLFNSMPKKTRKMLVEDQCNYVEIDVQAMVPNILKLVMDDSFFDERPYNLVATSLLKSKLRLKEIDNCSEELVSIIANIIKKPILIIFNNEYLTEKKINSRESGREIYNILIENGLANTSEEENIASISVKNMKESEAKYINKFNILYTERQTRWEKNVGTFFQCPTFNMKPSDIFKAMKNTLQGLEGFMLTSNWSWTQLIESELLVDISLDLEQDKLLPLFVHDAFYVPQEYEQKYREKVKVYLPLIVKDFISIKNTKENMNKIEKDFTSRVKKYLSSSTRNEFKINSITNNDFKLLTNKIRKIMKNEITNFVKFNDNKFIFPILVKEHKDYYSLLNKTIRKIINNSK